MPAPVFRAMLPADVAPATELILGNDWGVRREWLEYAASSPACVPLVAEADGELIGTGVGTTSGAVGWLGTIFLAPAWRGRGIGRAMTQTLIDRLEAAGCRTLVLVATSEGRRIYERMGFEVETRYRILEIGGLPADTADEGGAGSRVKARAGARGGARSIRLMIPSDLGAVLALDREATGEDRRHALERFTAGGAAGGAARVLPAADGGLDGFVVRAPWGGGATVARSADAALAIIDARRTVSGPAGRVRVGLLAENEEGLDRLTAAGFTPQWSAPRMVRGEALAWRPDWIYGQFNHAMG